LKVRETAVNEREDRMIMSDESNERRLPGGLGNGNALTRHG
jgi:hypothetical protein